MNLLADEGVDRQIVEALRSDNHSVLYAAELAAGRSDEWLLAQANSQSAVFLTTDKDFGDLVFRQRRTHAGVVLIRLAGLPAAHKASLVCESLRAHGHEMIGAFTVIAAGGIRIRTRL